MNQDVFEKILYSIMNAQLNSYPFPHFVAKEAIPATFHEALLANLPDLDAYIGIHEAGLVTRKEGTNPNATETRYLFRFFEDMDKLPAQQRPFWEAIKASLLSERFANAMIRKFSPFISERFQQKGKQETISMRLDLLRDFTGYELGPHTDTGRRLLNIFFYLPKDNTRPELGTSLYIPAESGFGCKGGPHYPFEKFINVYTAPYTRGTAMGFFRNNQSFHGVEPVATAGIERNALAFSMYAD